MKSSLHPAAATLDHADLGKVSLPVAVATQETTRPGPIGARCGLELPTGAEWQLHVLWTLFLRRSAPASCPFLFPGAAVQGDWESSLVVKKESMPWWVQGQHGLWNLTGQLLRQTCAQHP